VLFIVYIKDFVEKVQCELQLSEGGLVIETSKVALFST
jgi:hypothetical protein